MLSARTNEPSTGRHLHTHIPHQETDSGEKAETLSGVCTFQSVHCHCHTLPAPEVHQYKLHLGAGAIHALYTPQAGHFCGPQIKLNQNNDICKRFQKANSCMCKQKKSCLTLLEDTFQVANVFALYFEEILRVEAAILCPANVQTPRRRI